MSFDCGVHLFFMEGLFISLRFGIIKANFASALNFAYI